MVAAVQARRRAGLEAGQPKAEPREGPADAGVGGLAHASARRGGLADVQQAAEKRAGAKNDRAGTIDLPLATGCADDARRGPPLRP